MTYDLETEEGRECSACGETEALGHAESCPRNGFAFLEFETLAAADAVYRMSGDIHAVTRLFRGHPTLRALGWNVVDEDADPARGTAATHNDNQRLTFSRPPRHAGGRETFGHLEWHVSIRRAAKARKEAP